MIQDHSESVWQVKEAYARLDELNRHAERGLAVNSQEGARWEIALVRALDVLRGSTGGSRTSSSKSRAYLPGRTYDLPAPQDLLDWDLTGLRDDGLQHAGRTAFVLMAAGAGSRLESLRDMPPSEWSRLGLGDLERSDFEGFSKATAPIGPVSKQPTTELILRSILAIARTTRVRTPVVLCYDNKSHARLMEIAGRFGDAGELDLHLKEEAFGLPAIAPDGEPVREMDGSLLVGSGGPGASLRALADPGFDGLDSGGSPNTLFEHFLEDHPQLDTLCFLQTDMPVTREVLLSTLGGKRRSGARVAVAAYDYPPGFQLGVVAQWITADGQSGFEIVDYADWTPQFREMLEISRRRGNRICAYSGLMVFDLGFGKHIVDEGLFRPEIHWHKQERTVGGEIRTISKMVLSLTDVVIESDSVCVVVTPAEELLPGKTPEAFAQCRQLLSHAARTWLTARGIQVANSVMAEIDPLVGELRVGARVRVLDNARMCLTGPLGRSAATVTIGDDVTVRGNVTVLLKGDYAVRIPDGSILSGDGTLVFGSLPDAKVRSPEPLDLSPKAGEIVEVAV